MMVVHAGSPATAVLIVAMAAACLFCAYEMWRACGPRTWAVVAVMNLAMIAVHWSMPAHHHGTPVPFPDQPMPALMGLATAVSLTEAVIAASVLYAVTRRRDLSVQNVESGSSAGHPWKTGRREDPRQVQ
ncbi:MAG: hypothetical protein PGN37_06645 [Mycobacterium kyogaense]|uniref:hypothetical protein n=1 Tax=Mycobacterium kyogaense TaxID=2212479 RepID=UPI002FF4EB91